MRLLILIALAALAHGDSLHYVPTVTSAGFIADTPEVAAAREAHLAEYTRAAAGVSPLFDYAEYYKFYPQYLVGSSAAPVTPEGFLADTPDVVAAKSAHYAEHAKVIAAAGLSPDYLYQEYHNSFRTSPFYKNAPAPAPVVVNTEGFIADTPEVAAAKQAHFAEYAKVVARA
ncbi:cuticle protein 2-like [Homalodisca vitripennis]|uniref:cuticle protein 2-like n=1 Tax=Homalodisca vitripennis TaxID=197043 RepID=UPI001EEA160B|nr:cuticle protein 2-like [Homalodisca vitripennis]